MIQNQIDPYIRVCMKAWLLCESAIHNELRKTYPSNVLIQACGDCGRSCFTLVSQLTSEQPNYTISKVWECFMICRQCALTCATYGFQEADYVLCQQACEDCAHQLKQIITFNLN